MIRYKTKLTWMDGAEVEKYRTDVTTLEDGSQHYKTSYKTDMGRFHEVSLLNHGDGIIIATPEGELSLDYSQAACLIATMLAYEEMADYTQHEMVMRLC